MEYSGRCLVKSARQLLASNRDFRRLFLATLVSLGGDWFSFVAVADLVTRLTGRPGAAAYVYAATVLPVFLGSPIAGAVADRHDRKRVLVIADLVRVPLALVLCLAALWGSVALAGVAIVALGVAASFHDPVASAATPNLVDSEDLPLAQSLMGALWGSMLLVGAGLGGVVADLFGTYVAFAINAASFALSAGLIGAIRRPLQETRAPERHRDEGDIREALQYVRRKPLVLRLLLAKTGVSSANGTVGLLPAFAHARFAGTNIAVGLLFAARGLGALLGPLMAKRLIGVAPSARGIVLVCGVSTLVYAAAYALLPLTLWFALALLLVTVAHLGGGAQWAISTYGLQVATPDALRGRVLSLDYGLATLAIGASSTIAGLLADAIGAAKATYCLVGVAACYGLVWLPASLAVAPRDAPPR